ncbi:hypothetical protein [Reichenbachiella sp. MALMAid0571]|uniref:hypothetical protein n=1 Tax=Reichenbachiella sp. MALMAid0571 TaxID=3143939 RepID=UPI0032DF7F63
MCITPVWAQPFKVGVISDFEKSTNLELIIDQMIHEIDQTTGAARKVSLGATSFGIVDNESAQRSYDQLDGQVDLVIALGSISAKSLSSANDLSTPVIALGIIDPGLQEIPYANGTSGKRNFTYIWPTRNLEKELETFHNIHEFSHVAVFVDEKAVSTVSAQNERNLIDSLSRKLNTELSIIPVGTNMEKVLSQLPAETDAAYFTVLLSQTESQIRHLIIELNERKIPTFSGNARLMDYGVLGSMTNENDLQQVIRKLAIMIDGIATGSDLSSMSVTLDTKDNLYVNIATARKIELPIPFEVLLTATIIGDDEGAVRSYSFEEIAEKSLASNLSIQISYQDIERSKVRVKSARSNVLPSIESGLTASQINEERASATFNAPEKSLTAGWTYNKKPDKKLSAY